MNFKSTFGQVRKASRDMGQTSFEGGILVGMDEFEVIPLSHLCKNNVLECLFLTPSLLGSQVSWHMHGAKEDPYQGSLSCVCHWPQQNDLAAVSLHPSSVTRNSKAALWDPCLLQRGAEPPYPADGYTSPGDPDDQSTKEPVTSPLFMNLLPSNDFSFPMKIASKTVRVFSLTPPFVNTELFTSREEKGGTNKKDNRSSRWGSICLSFQGFKLKTKDLCSRRSYSTAFT